MWSSGRVILENGGILNLIDGFENPGFPLFSFLVNHINEHLSDCHEKGISIFSGFIAIVMEFFAE